MNSKARQNYLEFKRVADEHFNGLNDEILNYVEELEEKLNFFPEISCNSKKMENFCLMALDVAKNNHYVTGQIIIDFNTELKSTNVKISQVKRLS